MEHPKTQGRRAALRLAVEIESGRIVSLGLPDAPPETRGFAREVLSGSLRWQARLDWTLAPLLNTPLSKLDPGVRAALRLATFERYWLRTPPAALVNEYVGLMRAEKLTSATGFVNAVLRKLPPEPRPAPGVPGSAEHLAVELSHPRWLVERWLARYGGDGCTALLTANNLPAPLGLRVNSLRSTRPRVQEALRARGIETNFGAWSTDALIVPHGGDPTQWPEWDSGAVIAQDEAAQLVARLVSPQPGERIIDAASAPGGKTTHLAQLMGNSGHIVACDVAKGRLKLVEENALRLGITIIETRAGDFRTLSGESALEPADRVLLDAPCSGTGTLRRRPDAKWRKTPDQLRELVTLQRELMGAAARLVKPGGTLIYSTCSLEPEENAGQVAWWLSHNPGWDLVPAGAEFAGARSPEGYLRTEPHLHGCDGMFAARLLRKY